MPELGFQLQELVPFQMAELPFQIP
jgi:hypothetical protein